MTILTIPEIPLIVHTSTELAKIQTPAEAKKAKLTCSPKSESKNPVIPIIPSLDQLGIKKPGCNCLSFSLSKSVLNLSLFNFKQTQGVPR
jgi:hypothetical protein